VAIIQQFIDIVESSLKDTNVPTDERNEALATLLVITQHLEGESYTCTKIAKDLAEMRGVKNEKMTIILALLERVGAISRVRSGRAKVITVLPK